MKARDVMTKDPACCTPDDTVQHAAKLMVDSDCGCIPVVENMKTKRIVGTLTDRDVTCRCTAEGKGPETRVGDVMSPNPSCCTADDDVQSVQRVMSDRQVRRVPVVDEQGCCVGMIAQADLARAGDHAITDREVGQVVERVSEPTREERH